MKLTLSKNDFFFAGKAIFTVKNLRTEEHKTYMIKVTKPNDRFPRPTTLLMLMTGTDNTRHYSYVGKIIRKSLTANEAYDRKEHVAGTVEMTQGSKFTDGSDQVKAGRWIVDRLWHEKEWPDFFEVKHAGFCGRCGRLLTNPESIERGIGPECWGKMHPEYRGE